VEKVAATTGGYVGECHPGIAVGLGLGSGDIWSVHCVDPFGGPCPGQVDCGNCNWKTAQGKTGDKTLQSHGRRSAIKDLHIRGKILFFRTHMTFTNMARPEVISMILAFTS